MLNKLIAFSLKNRMFVVIAALLVSMTGSYLASQMPIDVLPNLNRPTVVIMTEAHAMVPEDVEQLVTLPLEQILNGATGVERVRSSSGLGLSVIKVEFGWGTDIYRNRQVVSEKLQLAKERLPEGVAPSMEPISSIMGQVQIIGLSSKTGKLSTADIRSLADYKLKYDLLSIAGVAKVIVGGGAGKQLQVVMDAEKLRTFNVTVNDVASAVTRNNQNRSGAFINIGTKAPAITVTGLLTNKAELENAVVLPHDLRPVRIRDVADVQFGPAAIKVGEVGVGGRPGVAMIVMKQPGYDTIRLSKEVEAALELSMAGMDEDLQINPHLFKQADFINRAIANVEEAVRDGGIMVVVILFIFLMNWRTTFITLTAIPISIAVTAIVFSVLGLSINTMTLGGLAVAIGALVDDAIVGMENVYRRLGQNIRLDKGEQRPAIQVIYDACSEVLRPILIGTMLVVVVYVPLFFLTGMEGKLFSPIGIAYIVSVTASLFVSLTVTPALCYLLLPNTMAKGEIKDTFVVRKLKVIAEFAIRNSIRWSRTVLATLVVLVGIALYLLLTAGSQFLPPFNEGVAQINLVLPPDTGLATSNAYGLRLEKLLIKVNGVKYVTRRTGRAEGDEHAEGVNSSEVIVSFDPTVERDREAIIDEVRTRIGEEFPGVAFAVDQPLAHLLSAMLSGVKAQVAVKIYGPDLETLRTVAKDVEGRLKEIDGVKDLMVEPQVLVPNIAIVPNRELLARHGLAVEDVGDTVELSLGGEAISRLVDGRYAYPIVLRLKEANRRSLQDLENLYIRKHNGKLIRLGDVAAVQQTMTSNNIKHENVGRRIVVQHNVAGRSLGEVVADVDRALEPVRQDLAKKGGYSLKISGQFEAQQEATKRILVLSVLSFLCMILILYMHFGSLNLSLQVMASIPMAFVGAVAFVIITHQTLSVATLVGLISLGGIAARNAILLLDHYIHLMKAEGKPFGPDVIVLAGQERMVPVMMTALTSGIALIPLALAPGQPGKEILYPVATVIIGGLISSTLLDFIVRPAVFYRFGRKAASRAADPEVSRQESILT